MRVQTALLATCLTVLVVLSRAQTPAGNLTATVAESCSCTVSRTCNFGGEPSRMPCEGNRMIAIEPGRSGDVDLAGFHKEAVVHQGADHDGGYRVAGSLL